MRMNTSLDPPDALYPRRDRIGGKTIRHPRGKIGVVGARPAGPASHAALMQPRSKMRLNAPR